MRIGAGFDAHLFAAGRKLVLGGVEIPFGKGLSGHSDADVVLHALMDAILGACGAGDIGERFPDEDPRYEGVSSLELLREVAALARDSGFRVQSVDCVVVCEEPAVAPYRDLMIERMSEALGCRSVSVKGTTTEGMGFTGRGEGIASISVALLAEEGDNG